MFDEKYYLQVEQELKESKRDEALWSKSMILAKDDEAEAKLQYIKARVAKLQKEEVVMKTKLTATKTARVVLFIAMAMAFVTLMMLFVIGPIIDN